MELQRPNIYVYTICWNEEAFLPYFLKYYSQFATKIILYDNQSTDRTLKICSDFHSDTCELQVITYNTYNQIRDDVYLEIKNEVWKHSRGKCDWCIVVDIDEIVYHPLGITTYLSNLPTNVALIQSVGYEMVSNTFFQNPDQPLVLPTEICKTGVASHMLNKTNIFRPNLVNGINYYGGCHICVPAYQGKYIEMKESPIKLLHFKFIYPLEWMIDRYKKMASRLSEQNVKHGWGLHYAEIQKLIQRYQQLFSKARQIIQ